MELGTKVTNGQIFRMILQKYLFGISRIRLQVLPIILIIIVGKILEVQVSQAVRDVSEALEKKHGAESAVWIFSVILLVSSLAIEFPGYIFTSGIQFAYRYTLRETFERFVELDAKTFNSYGCGTIQAIIERKSRAISELIEVTVLNFLPTFAVISFVSMKVFSVMGLFPVLIVLVTVFLYIVYTIKIAIWRNNLRRDLNKYENNAVNMLYDSLNNHEAVVSHNNYAVEVERYDKVLAPIQYNATQLMRGLFLLNMGQKTIFALQLSLILLLGMSGYFGVDFKTKDILFYMTIGRVLSANLGNLGFMYLRYTQALINIRETYDQSVETKKDEGFALEEFNHNITFQDVFLSHCSKSILNGVSFSISRGDKVALIGPNGAGKSTLLKALLKLNSYSGSILIDGNDIHDIQNSSFRKLVSYMPQNPTLFNDSVLYNIKYSAPTTTDFTVLELAKKYGVHDAIMALESGYMTNVGEGGKKLSGGERQKVALLRALLKEAPVLVMDEPTSNMDKASEFLVLSKILSATPGLTVISIVHNFDLLKYFNKICLLENGTTRMITDIENDLPEFCKKA